MRWCDDDDDDNNDDDNDDDDDDGDHDNDDDNDNNNNDDDDNNNNNDDNDNDDDDSNDHINVMLPVTTAVDESDLNVACFKSSILSLPARSSLVEKRKSRFSSISNNLRIVACWE